MKVLHIISGDLWAGAEVQAFTLLTTLQQQPGVTVCAALMNEGELAERLRRRNIPVTVLPETTLSVLGIVTGLRTLMQNWQPDIVHTHRIKENILGSIANRLTRNVASVRSVHGASEHAPKGFRQIHKKLMHLLNHRIGLHLQKKIIAVSSDLADRLANEFPREQIAVIENGVDIEAVRAQVHAVEFRTAQPEAVHIGIVGRLVPVKRVDLFLETAKVLLQQQPTRNWHFHIFGDGPLQAKLKQQAAQTTQTDAITFHGHRSDIVACIAALDVLVMCSDHEGLPMTLLEAMALGTKIVGHNVGGIAQLLKNETTGWLVNQQDASAYATAIQYATTDSDDCVKHSAAARASADDYSSTLCAQRHIELYATCIGQAQTG